MSETPLYDAVMEDLEFNPKWSTAIASRQTVVSTRTKRHHPARREASK